MGIDAIIFVIDSTDSVRPCVVKDELEHFLAHQKELREDKHNKSLPSILFCCNKRDLPDAQTTQTIETALDLKELLAQSNAFHLTSTNGLTGDGLREGLDWLA